MKIEKLSTVHTIDYFKLRLASLKDHPESFSASFEEEMNNGMEVYRDRLEQSGTSLTFGAFNDTELIGVVTIVKESKIKLAHRTNIASMYVKPHFRKSGIGKALMKHALNEIKKDPSIEQVYLSVHSANHEAKHLYDSLGFQIYGTEKNALKYQDRYYSIDHMVLFLG